MLEFSIVRPYFMQPPTYKCLRLFYADRIHVVGAFLSSDENCGQHYISIFCLVVYYNVLLSAKKLKAIFTSQLICVVLYLCASEEGFVFVLGCSHN